MSDRTFTVWEPEGSDIVDRFEELPGARSGNVIRAMEVYLGVYEAATRCGVDIDDLNYRSLRRQVVQALLDHWAGSD